MRSYISDSLCVAQKSNLWKLFQEKAWWIEILNIEDFENNDVKRRLFDNYSLCDENRMEERRTAYQKLVAGNKYPTNNKNTDPSSSCLDFGDLVASVAEEKIKKINLLEEDSGLLKKYAATGIVSWAAVRRFGRNSSPSCSSFSRVNQSPPLQEEKKTKYGTNMGLCFCCCH